MGADHGCFLGIASHEDIPGIHGLIIFILNFNIIKLFVFAGLHFKLKDLKLARLSTFPIFFGQLTGAYEGIGTVRLGLSLQS